MTKPDYDCSRVVPIEDEPRHHLVIANDFVRAFVVEIPPGDRTLCHRHPNDYLLYVALGSEIISAAREGEPKRLNYADGECEMSAAGLIHVVENLGNTPFRNIVVELLPNVAALRRKQDPQTMSGEAEVRQVFDDPRAAIFEIEAQPGSEILISGPAVVATPYGHELSQATSGAVEIRRDSICDLAWVAAQKTTVFALSNAARLLVFPIGAK